MDFTRNCNPKASRDPSDKFQESCENFLRRHYMDRFSEILSQSNSTHVSVYISFLDLMEDDHVIGNHLINSPEKILKVFDKAAKVVLLEKYEREAPRNQNHPSFSRDSLKQKLNSVHVRVHSLSLPYVQEIYRTIFPSCKEAGKLLCLIGTVARVAPTKLLEYSKSYQCNRCKEIIEYVALPSRHHLFPKTVDCPNLCANAKVCSLGETNAKNAEMFSKFYDYQEIKLQEQVQKIDFGVMPKAVTVILEDDLVESCKPGDDVAITNILSEEGVQFSQISEINAKFIVSTVKCDLHLQGYLYLRWKPFKPGVVAESELVFKANHVAIQNDQKTSLMITDEMRGFVSTFWEYYKSDPFSGRNHIIASFCPQIYGLYIAKLAMCIILCGGVSKKVSGTRIRGESHLLLVGDPGTGKSQLLKYASLVTNRSVITTGIGASSAGLTVSAVKEGGEWHLEAGALVLADQGVCCIDEFSCMREHDKTSIHEAMEQQSISVAKAGMVVKLPTRVTVIAATNPKGKYDANMSLPINVGIASPLLSRFDVVMVLADTQDPDWDSFLSDFIIEGRDMFTEALKNVDSAEIWDINRLKAYFVLVKELEPELSNEANEVIAAYYQYQRTLEERNPSRTTVRLLESLRRLSEGHARLMFRTTITLHDAITAVSIIEASMQSSSMVENYSNLHVRFPEDPFEEYYSQARIILGKLDLTHLWNKEKIFLEEMRHNVGSSRPSFCEFVNEESNEREETHISMPREECAAQNSPTNFTDDTDKENDISFDDLINSIFEDHSSTKKKHPLSSSSSSSESTQDEPCSGTRLDDIFCNLGSAENRTKMNGNLQSGLVSNNADSIILNSYVSNSEPECNTEIGHLMGRQLESSSENFDPDILPPSPDNFVSTNTKYFR